MLFKVLDIKTSKVIADNAEAADRVAEAVNFNEVCGCSIDGLLADQDGELYLLDSTGTTHHVPTDRFVAVAD
jgi:hypothetical protein